MPIADVLRQELNDIQRPAATDTASEVLTLACAGSGKSRTLAFRIAWLIAERAADPAGIVSFTFTEKAADSIKLRVADALTRCDLDTNYLGRMYIGTIHSYCQYLLGQMDARYRQFDVLDENRLRLYLIDNYPVVVHPVRQARNNVPYFRAINEVADAWAIMNEELLTPEQVAAPDPVLGQCLATLRDRMDGDQFIDFTQMQRLVVEALRREDPGVLTALESLQHLLVDEYQDINPVQDELIRLLHRRSATLFVVGDDDQSIYGWRGADVTRIQTFQIRYPDATSHTLSTNYRSSALIVSSADHLAHQELGAVRIVKNPVAIERNVPQETRVLWFATRADEAAWVVTKIRGLLGTAYVESDSRTRGLTPADFAILMRSTRMNEPNGHPPRHTAFSDGLAITNIPYTLESGGGLFDRPHVAALRATFELLRGGQPTRNAARAHFDGTARQCFPNGDFEAFAGVLAEWGRLIHAPIVPGAPRRRIYPQQLLHDLLESFRVASTALDNAVLLDIGVFSQILQDVEAVYPSVDSTGRFTSILNFLSVVADRGYDSSTYEVLARPDAVTISTVHKMKGLEFPVVFIVDVENQRFPKKRSSYSGWLPQVLLRDAINRGSYQSTRQEEARLFYTAMTRAERFLYITGTANGPGWQRPLGVSPFVAHLADNRIVRDAAAPTPGLVAGVPARRIDAASLPTSYSDLKYYLRCPKDYQFRRIFGFSPPIPDLFGFGMTVHASVGKLHQDYPDAPPSVAEAERIADGMFHLKHVQPSRDPVNRPGPYERAKARATNLVGAYARDFAPDFSQRRQVEARFEIPISGAVVSGAIDLMLQEDEQGNIIDACVVDFKTLEGGEQPLLAEQLEWTELSLQVQLYAKAARDVLGEVANRGHVHLLKDSQRIEVPVDDAAVAAALAVVEWAVNGIVREDFPMRPHTDKCPTCDFKKVCPKIPQQFRDAAVPPRLHVPGVAGGKLPPAFALFDPDYEG